MISPKRAQHPRKNHRQLLWLCGCLLFGGVSACVGPDLEPPGSNQARGAPGPGFTEMAGAGHSASDSKGAEPVGALPAAGGPGTNPPMTAPVIGSGGSGASIPQQPTTTSPASPASMTAMMPAAAGSAAGAAGAAGGAEDAGVEDGGRDAGTLRH